MASPPYQGAASPPGPSPLALPRQRPTLALPSGGSSRKSSQLSTPSLHPLRQTSFPPADSLEAQHHLAQQQRQAQFSPEGEASLDDLSDTEITSAISGPVGDEAFGKKRKRGEKRNRGRPPKNSILRASSASVVNGDDARSTTTARRGGTAGAPSVVTGDAEGDEEDDEEDEDAALGGRAADEGFSLDPAEMDREKQRRTLFRETVPPAHQNRYDAFNKAKLRTQDIRRLVNATLSQSVPPGVTIVVGAYTKMFAGMLIESAREVQAEWMAIESKRPDDDENRAYKRLKLSQPTEPERPDQGKGDAAKKSNHDAPETAPNEPDNLPDGDALSEDDENQPGDTQPNSDPSSVTKNGKRDEMEGIDVQPGAWGLSNFIDEHDRGPLLPDHLREALRRYKKLQYGGSVGFTGLSLEGRDVAAPRMAGRRLFR